MNEWVLRCLQSHTQANTHAVTEQAQQQTEKNDFSIASHHSEEPHHLSATRMHVKRGHGDYFQSIVPSKQRKCAAKVVEPKLAAASATNSG
mmetsp:Transcript_10406/g.22946  ORF Transcript_10406/g.22946 Transcript_10406/m.22946 type:complete len:91 (-) Transcript_10406:68-340(-)